MPNFHETVLMLTVCDKSLFWLIFCSHSEHSRKYIMQGNNWIRGIVIIRHDYVSLNFRFANYIIDRIRSKENCRNYALTIVRFHIPSTHFSFCQNKKKITWSSIRQDEKEKKNIISGPWIMYVPNKTQTKISK